MKKYCFLSLIATVFLVGCGDGHKYLLTDADLSKEILANPNLKTCKEEFADLVKHYENHTYEGLQNTQINPDDSKENGYSKEEIESLLAQKFTDIATISKEDKVAMYEYCLSFNQAK